jgi:hypothetical protein
MNVVRREKATADKRPKAALSARPEARFKNSADVGETDVADGAALPAALIASRNQAAKTWLLLAAVPAGADERIHHTKLASTVIKYLSRL